MSLKRNEEFSGLLFGLILLLVLTPITYWGLIYLEQKNKTLQLNQFSKQTAQLIEKSNQYTEDESFWCYQLTAEMNRSKTANEFLERIQSLRKITGERLPCTIWNEEKELFYNNFRQSTFLSEKQLAEIIHPLNECLTEGKDASPVASIKIRGLFGWQFRPGKIGRPSLSQEPNFLRPDARGRLANLWVGTNGKITALVYFHKTWSKDGSGLRYFAHINKNSSTRIAFVDSNKRFTKDLSEFEQTIRNLENEGKFSIIFNEMMIAGKRVSGLKTMVVFQHYESLLNPGKFALLICIISMFLLITLIRQCNNSISLARLSIKWQLLLLLFTTTGIPIIALGIIASEHLAQKRTALIKEGYQKCVDFVQHIDQRGKVRQSILINRANKTIDSIRKFLPEKFPERIVAKEIRKKFRNSLLDFRMISRDSTALLTGFGYYRNKKFHFFKKNSKAENKISVEARLFNDISYYFLSVLNGRTIDYDKFTEAELFTEMFYQKPFHEMIQNLMLANGQIIPLGWGTEPYPALLKLISLKEKAIKDYFFLALFNKSASQKEFIDQQINNIERNPLGLKFLYSDQYKFSRKWEPIISDSWFGQIFKKTGNHPASEPLFTTYEGKKCVYAGIKGQNFDSFYFFAFYPLEEIEKQIAQDRQFIFSAGIMALLMLAGLALSFSSGFASPLSSLQTGAVAIRERNFEFRLPVLSHDEFGEMAKIFNKSMEDFEELSLASIVQTRLFPQSGIETDNFSLYGHSVPMAELGGDYFDYFKIDDDHYSMLLGDVAGHGVGASLIMAMAKAGIMYSENILDDPSAVMTRLHQLIHATRTKAQRKIMTFQYLYYNQKTGHAVYSNAGGCSPILVDHETDEVKEITLTAPVLGGFKNSKFTNLEITIKPGQSLIFYTDGIIESQNPAGNEIGYEGFKEILLRCLHNDAKTFYERVYKEYLQWIAGREAQDDLTLIILTRRAKSEDQNS
jgi:serine phosphatase RsbU (regulator of sigma subunit)